jgi:hypothetical protein
VESVLDCPPEKVWAEVQTPSLLREIIRPLMRIVPVDSARFPERWEQGATVRCQFCLFGMIPLGVHTLFLQRVDQTAREIQSRESDPLISRWDHLVRVRPTEDGRCLYSDEIEIEAGLLTMPVWAFANWFYRHLQRNWRRVANRLART